VRRRSASVPSPTKPTATEPPPRPLSDNGRSREGCALRTIDHDPRGRIVVLDSITRCEGNAGARDVVMVGSFAGAMSLGFGLEIGDSMLFARPDNRNDVSAPARTAAE